MVITSENSTHAHEIRQQTADSFSTFWVDNMTITSSDSKKSIERKINLLTSLKDNLITNIDVNTLPNRVQKLNFIKLIAQITEQIQEFEINIGKYSRQDLNRIGQHLGKKHQEPVVSTHPTTAFRSFDATDINLMLNAFTMRDFENQEFLEKKWATLKALGDFTLYYTDKDSLHSLELEEDVTRFLSEITDFKTYFRRLNTSDICMMLNALSVRDSENQEFFEKKLAALEALKEFSIKYIDIESMSSRESKAAYIRLLSKITDNIESLEILSGKITVEQIKAASQSFARKWESPVGIID